MSTTSQQDSHKDTAAESSLEEENQRLKAILACFANRIIEEEGIGRVFHDFNNILSSSMGYASLASERSADSGDEKLVRYLGNIEKAGIRARDLVKERLEHRHMQRFANKANLSKVLSPYVGGGAVKVPEVFVYIEEMLLVQAFAQIIPRETTVHSVTTELVDESTCSGCDHEIRGRQYKVSLHVKQNQGAVGGEQASAEFALAEALINSSGGHLCQSLVQDEDIVVYLRAVEP